MTPALIVFLIVRISLELLLAPSACGCVAPLRRATGCALSTWRGTLSETTRHVLMEHAGNERLIWNAFLECLGLNVAQVTGRQADVDPPILDGGGTGGRLELGKLSLGCHRFEPPFLEGTENFELIRV